MFDTFKKVIYKLKNKLFIFFIFIIPKINRQKLIEIARENDSFEIVEDEYECFIKEPLQNSQKKDLKIILVQKKLSVFLVLLLKMLD